MHSAKLKFDGGEIAIDRDVTTIGRTSDNMVSFPGDSNVSRYHAEIENRDGDHYLIDLNSSNGTTVNGNKVTGDIRLSPGDKIVFGGSSEAEFTITEAADEAASASPVTGPDPDNPFSDVPGVYEAQNAVGSLGYRAASDAQYAALDAVHGAAAGGSAVPAASGGSTVLIAGAVVGVAVVCAIAAGAIYMTRGSSSCDATARIVKPEAGDTITASTEIELKVENSACVQSAVFTIDGREVAVGEAPQFTATLDPKSIPEYADGVDHNLEVALIDENGVKIVQPGSVMLAFETRAVTKPTGTPVVTQANTDAPKTSGRGQPSLVQINEMSLRLIKQFSGNPAYNISNKQFLQEIQKRTAEYAQEGFSQRAAAYRDTINVAFMREQNIDAPFGFILAMSRSKFVPDKMGSDEGLWRMNPAFVSDNKYNGMCGTETLSDPSQNCAARSTALYMKAIIYGVFDGDLVYSAAAFGKTTQDAAAWKATLPQNRSDVWNSIKTAPEREQLVRFFAAGIVGDNPQAFGLAKDRPLSELYRVTM